MYEQDGKQYTIKLNDLADEHGVSLRTVQKKLTAERYKNDLEGEFIRTASDGTWLTKAGAEFIAGTFKTRAVGYVTTDRYERRIAELEQELYKTQREYTAYVSHATPLLQKASEQLALAERSGEYKERIDALETQNAVLSHDNEELGQKIAETTKTAQKASQELLDARKQFEDEKHLLEQQIAGMKKASLWQRIRGWK